MLPPTDQAAPHPLPGWMPIHWSWNGGAPVVDWCDLGDLRLTAPFFAQTVQDAQDRSRIVRRTPATFLEEWPEAGPGARPAGLIFHLSRCGSTLAAQTLAALPENIVLSEPQTVDEVLWAGMIHPDAVPTRCVPALRGLARAYGWQRFPLEKRFFIKFDPWHLLHFDLIRAAFPGVPWVFLYRDPVEILVSQLTEVSGRMLPGPMIAAYLGLPLWEVVRLPQEELCARALGRIAAAAVEVSSREPELGRVLNYSQLPGALEADLFPWFGVDLDDAGRALVQQTTGFHAKSPGRPFRADVEAKQRLATAELRALAARWVGPAYSRLETIRATQTGRC